VGTLEGTTVGSRPWLLLSTAACWQAHASGGRSTCGVCPTVQRLNWLHILSGCHEGVIEVSSLAMNPDGTLLASAGNYFDPTITLWPLDDLNPPGGEPQVTLEVLDEAGSEAAAAERCRRRLPIEVPAQAPVLAIDRFSQRARRANR